MAVARRFAHRLGVGVTGKTTPQHLCVDGTRRNRIDTDAIRGEIQRFINAGYLQQPDANRLYVVYVEPGVPREVIFGLETRGQKIAPSRAATSANTIMVTPAGFVGAPDPRTRGATAAGY